jgi:hypothetical protein
MFAPRGPTLAGNARTHYPNIAVCNRPMKLWNIHLGHVAGGTTGLADWAGSSGHDQVKPPPRQMRGSPDILNRRLYPGARGWLADRSRLHTRGARRPCPSTCCFRDGTLAKSQWYFRFCRLTARPTTWNDTLRRSRPSRSHPVGQDRRSALGQSRHRACWPKAFLPVPCRRSS